WVLLGSVHYDANMNDYADQFIGFNSDQPVKRVVFDYEYVGIPDTHVKRYIDDVTFNVAGCFPEPVPSFLDADGDGEHDLTDKCPATAPRAIVDDSGCSQSQFCGSFHPTSSGYVRGTCNSADWRNDQPLGAHDCLEAKGVCLPTK